MRICISHMQMFVKNVYEFYVIDRYSLTHVTIHYSDTNAIILYVVKRTTLFTEALTSHAHCIDPTNSDFTINKL